MTKFFTLLLFLFSTVSVFTQTTHKKIDSLELLITKSLVDSIKVKQQITLTQILDQSEAVKSEYILKNALKTLQKNTYTFKDKLKQQSYVYDLLGVIERRKSNFKESLNYYLKSLSIKEKINDSINKGRSYHNIAMLFYSQKNYKKASTYMHRALVLRKKFNDSVKYAKSLNSQGLFMYKLKKKDSALYYYNKAKTYFNKNYRIADVNRNLATIYKNNKEYYKAIDTYNESLLIFKNHNLLERTAITYISLSSVYRRLNNIKKAKNYLNKAEVIANKTNNKKAIYLIYSRRYKIASLEKDDKKALYYLKAYKRIKDSIYSVKNSQKIIALELNYAFAKEKIADSLSFLSEKKTLKAINATQKTQKHLFITLFIVSIIGLVYIVLIFLHKKKLNKEKQEKEQLQNELLTEKLENINNYAEQLVVDNKMRLQFKEELIEKIKTIKNRPSTDTIKTHLSLIIDLQKQINTEKRLDTISEKQEHINLNFEKKLIKLYPSLSKNEREICSLIKLNLSNKEIMNIRNITLDSIKSARYRIRKKMNIPKGEELEKVISNLN